MIEGGAISISTFIEINQNDEISLEIANEDSTTDLIVSSADIEVHRIR